MTEHNNVVLCGFMGCGKSTVGKRLAALLGYGFADMDACIEEQAGMRVSDIFAQHGERHFRVLETQVCRELAAQSNLVIAAGGGALVSPENARILRERCVVVWLDVSAQTVLSRLEGDATRPLLQGDDKAQRVCALLAKRRPLYEAAAHLTVAGDGTPEEVAWQIAHALKK